MEQYRVEYTKDKNIMSQPVTVTFVPEQLLTWIIIGLIAGVLASALVRGRRYGFITSIIVGLLGAFLGGFVFSVLRIPVPAAFAGGITLAWSDILVSFIGAVIILILFGGIYRRRYN
jgi:uncharacterized membrane protein YeaQ/YmgE (transglycosylase-associated protein family)